MDSAVPEENSSFQNGKLKVIRIQERGTKGNKVCVLISDGSSFFISFRSVEDLGIYPGMILSSHEMEALQRAAEYHRGYEKAVDLVARSEHSRFQLFQKLLKRGFSDTIAEEICRDFEKRGFIDDQRYAEMWIESRCRRRPEGPDRINAGLRGRGISREVTENAVSRFFTEENLLAVFYRAVEKEKRRYSENPEALKKRLCYLGFPSYLIRSYLKNNH